MGLWNESDIRVETNKGRVERGFDWGYLGNLRLEVPVFHLEASLLSQSRRQGRVLVVQQGLQVFDPQQRHGQIGLLLGVPATDNRVLSFIFPVCVTYD